MSLLNIITTAILLIPAFFLIKTLVSFIIDINGHRKTMNKMKDWSRFHKQLLNWSDEILDQEIKKEYLLYCLEIFSNNGEINIESLKQLDINKLRENLTTKYSSHIPTLRQETRNNKLIKILN